ncbi:uncharacterized protein LOC126606990 [Malus sylvestris]|uniref:uncharacterized protein LOC126606990 n=1 Tax=Malus sylvestris TaxID=3752 RepID=UPI0021AD2BFC|nr:uncharacterized protein LOC126606990 [Malus sylvestris]
MGWISGFKRCSLAPNSMPRTPSPAAVSWLLSPLNSAIPLPLRPRVPCRSGMCTTPLHVTSSQLIASEIFPVTAVKGELVRALGGVVASTSLLGVLLGHNSLFLQGPAFAPPMIRQAIWCGSTNSTTEEVYRCCG